MMNLYQMYFSPTGGTKRVAEIITGAWEQPVTTIDLMKKDEDFAPVEFGSEDVCVIAVPSFGGRVPEVAVKALEDLQGNNCQAILVVVFGNRAIDDTLLELKEIVSDAGFRCVAAMEAVAQHSIFSQFGTGRPDEKDEAQLEEFSLDIKEALEMGALDGNVKVPGNKPYREYNGVPFKPMAGKECTACGICARECPVQAIPEDNPQLVDKGKCISCMRCISVCPTNARKNSKAMLMVAGKKMKRACEGRKENRLYGV